jgi:hypothetical protein
LGVSHNAVILSPARPVAFCLRILGVKDARTPEKHIPITLISFYIFFYKEKVKRKSMW